MKKKYNILMIAPTPFFSDRGCHVRIYEEASALINQGHSISICTYHLGQSIDSIPIFRILNIPWYKKISAGPSIHKIYLDIFLVFLTLKMTLRIKPDVIYGHLHEGAFIGKITSFLFNIPLFFDYQGSLTDEATAHGFIKKGTSLHTFFSWIEKKINSLPHAIFTSSSIAAKNLKKELLQIPVRALMDAVDTDRFNPCSSPVGQPLPNSSSKIKVVYLGLLNQYQGIDILLESIHLIAQQKGDGIEFILMGYPNVEFYRQKAKKIKIDHIVTFPGRIPYWDAPQKLLVGDIAVSPKLSKTEANGKLINYMACGLPTIAFDSQINKEILGNSGVYAKWGDALSLAQCIIDLANDKMRRKKLSKKLRERAEKHFTWTQRIKIVETQLNKLL